jgi:hypothetical protein
MATCRLGNSGLRAGFVSARPTRRHNWVRHEPDPISNRVDFWNRTRPVYQLSYPNMTRVTRCEEEEPKKARAKKLRPRLPNRDNRLKKKKDEGSSSTLRLRLCLNPNSYPRQNPKSSIRTAVTLSQEKTKQVNNTNYKIRREKQPNSAIPAISKPRSHGKPCS